MAADRLDRELTFAKPPGSLKLFTYTGERPGIYMGRRLRFQTTPSV